MKANELSCKDLMVGDWIKPKNVDATFRVGLIGVDSVWNDTDTHEWDYDELEPILLTPEILEKNGFHKEWDEDVVLMVRDTIIVEIGNMYKMYKDGKMYLRRVLAPLYYVHELQHALRLCGIEKEIEL